MLLIEFWLLFAYVGPGISTGAIAFVLGILFSVFLTLVAVVYYPLKRIFKRNRNSHTDICDANSETD